MGIIFRPVRLYLCLGDRRDVAGRDEARIIGQFTGFRRHRDVHRVIGRSVCRKRTNLFPVSLDDQFRVVSCRRHLDIDSLVRALVGCECANVCTVFLDGQRPIVHRGKCAGNVNGLIRGSIGCETTKFRVSIDNLNGSVVRCRRNFDIDSLVRALVGCERANVCAVFLDGQRSIVHRGNCRRVTQIIVTATRRHSCQSRLMLDV